MPTFKLTLAYDGTEYSGWARQPNAPTVQGALEAAIAQVVGEPVVTLGSSRTDSGVHAFGQVVGFSCDTRLAARDLARALNATLPDDIVVRGAETVDDAFDAIIHARRKRYRYLIHDTATRPLFGRQYAWHVRAPLDTAAMLRAAQSLLGTHDFASFQSAGSERQSTVRTIYDLTVRRGGFGWLSPLAAVDPQRPSVESYSTSEAGGELIAIEVEGNGFLYNMVRAIAGTLVAVGRGTRSESFAGEALAARKRSAAGMTAPAHGLFLLWIECDMSDESTENGGCPGDGT